MDVLEAAQDVDLLIGKDDARARGVLNGKLGLAVFAGYATDCAAKMFALERFDVFDLEGFDVKVVLRTC